MAPTPEPTPAKGLEIYQSPKVDPTPEIEVELQPDIEIPEENVPLVDAPNTGDKRSIFIILAVVSAIGLAALAIVYRKDSRKIV